MSGRVPRTTRTVALLLYVAVLSALVFAPFDFGLPTARGGVSLLFGPGQLAESVAHALLFLPLGPLLAARLDLTARDLLRRRVVPWVLSAAVLTEVAQLWVSRGVSLADAVMNVAGYGAGALLVWLHERSPAVRSAVARLLRPPALVGETLACAVLAYLCLVPVEGLPFGRSGIGAWNADFPLSIGNELTGDRPWRGRIDRIEIGGGAGAVALYGFRAEDLVLGDGGTVRKVRPAVGPPLHQRGSPILPSRGGVRFEGPAALVASGETWRAALGEIIDSGRLVVRARFVPADVEQGGPARIVSSSRDTALRNFTLGQEGDGLVLRVRTPFTGPNGDRPSLRVGGCLAAGVPAEVVAAYQDGSFSLCVDGKERGRVRTTLLLLFADRFLGAPLEGAVLLTLAFVAWSACFLPLWLLARRGLGGAILAACGAAALVVTVWMVS